MSWCRWVGGCLAMGELVSLGWWVSGFLGELVSLGWWVSGFPGLVGVWLPWVGGCLASRPNPTLQALSPSLTCRYYAQIKSP